MVDKTVGNERLAGARESSWLMPNESSRGVRLIVLRHGELECKPGDLDPVERLPSRSCTEISVHLSNTCTQQKIVLKILTEVQIGTRGEEWGEGEAVGKEVCGLLLYCRRGWSCERG